MAEEVQDEGLPLASGAARRFRLAIETKTVFSEEQLIAYDLPYRPSAARYAKAAGGPSAMERMDCPYEWGQKPAWFP